MLGEEGKEKAGCREAIERTSSSDEKKKKEDDVDRCSEGVPVPRRGEGGNMAGKGKEAPYLYVKGTNEYLDAIIGDEVVYIVNREKGRKPVSANSPEEALENYRRLYGK